jgi:hypothetical protein
VIAHAVDAHRSASRVAAYVYGDVLVLAAAAGVSHGAARSGEAVLIVAATVVSTYLAHVLADTLGAIVAGARLRPTVRAEIRDALPVISAGVPPALLFAAAELHWLGAALAQDLACGFLLARIAAVGLLYRHFHPEVRLARALSLGAVAAAVAAVAVAIKLSIAH